MHITKCISKCSQFAKIFSNIKNLLERII